MAMSNGLYETGGGGAFTTGFRSAASAGALLTTAAATIAGNTYFFMASPFSSTLQVASASAIVRDQTAGTPKRHLLLDAAVVPIRHGYALWANAIVLAVAAFLCVFDRNGLWKGCNCHNALTCCSNV